MQHRVTLNIRHEQSPEDWNAVTKVYKSMPGWFPTADLPRWYGTEDEAKYIWASVEPGGVVFEAMMAPKLWDAWLSELSRRLSSALGQHVHDTES
jgi:hypothetical protein